MTVAQAALADVTAARDRECKGGVVKFCREREASVTERRQTLDAVDGSSQLWLVTDVGTRVVVAIAVKEGWLAGPPYAVQETVFDEDDFAACTQVEQQP